MYFHYVFHNYLPFEKGVALQYCNLKPLYPRMLCVKFGWNWPSGSGEEDFKNSSMYFRSFLIISPWKRARPFIWINFNAFHPRMLCANFGWNWPQWFWRRRSVKSLQRQRRRKRRRTTDKLWSEKLTWAFDSGELRSTTYVNDICVTFKL